MHKRINRKAKSRLVSLLVILLLGVACCEGVRAQSETTPVDRRPPVLGADVIYADYPHPLIQAWQSEERSQDMADAFKTAGLRTLRFSFHGFYSPLGPEASEKVKAENKMKNQFPWFPFDRYLDFIARHDFTTVVAVNVEEGPDVALGVVKDFTERNLRSKLIAIELSNEPWLNHRPWLPEEYAARAADIIESLTPTGVRFALPLTVGKDRNTPTKLSDNEWVTRMLRALTARVDLKNRPDVYGVLHLYSRGVNARTVKSFNQVAKPFAPKMRYLVTEFNIRLSLEDNPHLTNKYAMELARRLAGLMAEPDIEAMYIHGVPYHSVLYWSNGRKLATVVGQSDPKLKGSALTRGWHLTPTGKVYDLYSRLAWSGEIIAFGGSEKQRYWAVRADDGRAVITLLNDGGKEIKKRVNVAGSEINLTAPPRSIVCYDQGGREIERLSLPY